ncbi:lactose-binding lectin l-2-like [Acanthaster planci]|uniref:Lactose-binding lectin l-2-like n=1 Tax=Acanthaster planci TaxID=133434 RepID=A0A8B7ZGA9_ACAPL|nr:lactose-binding lectin l-2-like [Acanthaster planci]
MALACLLFLLCVGCCYTTCQEVRCMGSIGGTCPPTWSQWEGKCYNATGRGLGWPEAAQECIQMGGVMAVPRSQNESKFFASLMPANNREFWINCKCSQQGDPWVCQEGATRVPLDESVQWDSDTNGDNEDCIKVKQCDWKWKWELCTQPLPAVCKKPVDPMLHFYDSWVCSGVMTDPKSTFDWGDIRLNNRGADGEDCMGLHVENSRLMLEDSQCDYRFKAICKKATPELHF